jgi:hypothetical protein
MSQQLLQQEDQESALGPPRFTLRELLLVMTALSCLFALMAAVGAWWSMAILLFLSLVLAHVLGNSLGTRLRDRANRGMLAGKMASRETVAAPVQLQMAAPQRLTQRVRLHRITLVMAVGAAVVGATLGGAGLFSLYPNAGPAAIGLGVVSSAVLGAFAGFATSSFLSVAQQALREALGDCNPAVHRLPPHAPH